MIFYLLHLSFILLTLLPPSYSSPAVCPSPSVEYNGTRIQFNKHHVSSYTFKVNNLECAHHSPTLHLPALFRWRLTLGPSIASYCVEMVSGEDLTVEMIHMELKVVTMLMTK